MPMTRSRKTKLSGCVKCRCRVEVVRFSVFFFGAPDRLDLLLAGRANVDVACRGFCVMFGGNTAGMRN